MGASLRYLSQRYTMPYKEVAGLFTDIGTEEPVPQRCKKCRNSFGLTVIRSFGLNEKNHSKLYIGATTVVFLIVHYLLEAY